MTKELELWQFIASRLKIDEQVMLLVVAESSGSSPGRQGYKMAVAANGELCGSIGGGVMEMNLVETAKSQISDLKFQIRSELIEQVHRKSVPHSSGMICSGKQSVITRLLTSLDLQTVCLIRNALGNKGSTSLTITADDFCAEPTKDLTSNTAFNMTSEVDFIYTENLGPKNELFVIGGGHCALALSELMSKMDFRISIFDDRPELNTIEKNRFADAITIIDGYEQIGELINAGANVYVVVMTLGYRSDEVVIRQILGKEFKYFGVLGSKAKMKTMLTALAKEGISKEKLDRIRAPIGLPINSHTPEEIAVSIAAEIISVKNS